MKINLSRIPVIIVLSLLLDACSTLPISTLLPTSPPPSCTFTPITPTFTPEPPTSTPSPTITPTPTLGMGSTKISSRDGMVMLYVPAGDFQMGGADSQPDKITFRTVYLDAFWIDQTEVTNAMYAKCVNDGKCDPPASNGSKTHAEYYGNTEFDNYPVVYVSWEDANAYCAWVDRRLLTDAEWEKAARGTDGRIYPWGNESPSNDLLNYNSVVGDTTEVGKYPNGASPYGALNMAGNIWEWVADWYNDNYYQDAPTSNPKGPESGRYRALRGGSWGEGDYFTRADMRVWGPPTNAVNIGFRCAMSASQ